MKILWFSLAISCLNSASICGQSLDSIAQANYENALLVAEKASIDHLIIIPDGQLHHLPFETFITAASSSKNISYKTLPYLLRNYKVSYNYSATLSNENQQVAVRKRRYH